MFHRILVPLDGSAFSEHAIPYATRIATALTAKLEFALVHSVYEPPFADERVRGALDDWEREQSQRDAAYIGDLVRRIAAETNLAIDPVVLSGEVVPVLEHEIRERGTDLVVMTSHGRAGLERAWLGSVADALIRHVDAPVLLIRPTEHEPIAVNAAAPRFTHVLIALDGSERAERALAPASALARMDEARVTLLRAAVPSLAMSSPYIPHAIELTRNELQQREAEARGYIDQKVHELRLQEIDAAGEVQVDYHPAHAVLRFADTSGVDLIALGTHGHGPIRRLVLGSTSDKIVRATNVPVLVC